MKAISLALLIFLAIPAWAQDTTIGSPAPLYPTLAGAKTLCVFGDSNTSNADAISLPNYYAQSLGSHATWLNLYSPRAFRGPQTGNYGVNGDTTALMLARVGSVIGGGCNVVVIQAGTNDVAASTSCTSIVSSLRAIFQALLGANIAVVDTTILPRTAPIAYTATQVKIALCVNTWRRQFARQLSGVASGGGYYLVDLDPVLTDMTAGSWTALANTVMADGVHPSALGGSIMANAIASAINGLIPQWLQPQVTASDAYDGTNNPYGNHLPNGSMAGTGGGVSTCSGTSPNSVAMSAAGWTGASGTCASSIATLTGGVRAHQVVLGGTLGSAQAIDISQTAATPGNIVAGDKVRGLVWLSVGGTNTNIAQLDPFLSITDGAGATFHHGFASSSPNAFPTAGFATGTSIGGTNFVPIFTDVYTATGTVTGLVMFLRLGNLAAGATASTVQTCCWEIRKVVP